LPTFKKLVLASGKKTPVEREKYKPRNAWLELRCIHSILGLGMVFCEHSKNLYWHQAKRPRSNVKI